MAGSSPVTVFAEQKGPAQRVVQGKVVDKVGRPVEWRHRLPEGTPTRWP